MALRPYWSGMIRMSLVSLPVNVFAALEGARQIPLHEIYRPTGQRVHHQTVVDGEPVDRKDIVKGYEVEKDDYVILEPDEIKALKVPSSKSIEITRFVDPAAIDDAYYDSPYYVAPDGKAAEAGFAVVREALRATGKVGLGQMAAGGRERLCSLKPCGSGMLLETLRYEDEIRKSDPYFAGLADQAVPDEELDLAKELIQRKSAKFDPAQFHDHYRDALRELIEAKREHRPPKEPGDDLPTTKVINLMDALRKSLRESSDKPAKKAKSKGKPKNPSHRKKAG